MSTRLEDVLALIALRAIEDLEPLQRVVAQFEHEARGILAGDHRPDEPIDAMIERALARSKEISEAVIRCPPVDGYSFYSLPVEPYDPLRQELPKYRRAKTILALVAKLTAPEAT